MDKKKIKIDKRAAALRENLKKRKLKQAGQSSDKTDKDKNKNS